MSRRPRSGPTGALRQGAPAPSAAGEGCPPCLVRAELQGPLQTRRRDSILRRCEQPGGREPCRHCSPRPVVEDRPGNHRSPAAASAALAAFLAQPLAACMPSGTADEPLRPPTPLQVVQARRIGTETGAELTLQTRVMKTDPGLNHPMILVRLNRDPGHSK